MNNIKNKLVGRVFLSDESFEEFERNLREAKQENDNIESNSEYKEVRAAEFYSKCYRYFIALLFSRKEDDKMPELKRAGVKLTADGTAQYKADLKVLLLHWRQMAEESKRNVVALGNNASASKKYGLAIKDLGNTAKLAK